MFECILCRKGIADAIRIEILLVHDILLTIYSCNECKDKVMAMSAKQIIDRKLEGR